jgi:hypothetical protein
MFDFLGSFFVEYSSRRSDSLTSNDSITTDKSLFPPNSGSSSSSSASSSGVSSSSSDSSTFSANNSHLPPWIEGIVFIRQYFSENELPIKIAYPENKFSTEMLSDIYETALPTTLRGNDAKEQKFLFRLRDKSLPGAVFKDENDEIIGTAITKSTVFYNCFVFFRQQTLPPPSFTAFAASALSPNTALSPTNPKNIERQTFRQAIILISKWPFPSLAYRLLEKVDEALSFEGSQQSEMNSANRDRSESMESVQTTEGGWKEIIETSTPPRSTVSAANTPGSETTDRSSVVAALSNPDGSLSSLSSYDVSETIVKSVFSVAVSQIELWPVPAPGIIVYLSFFGEMLHYMMPSDILTTYGANLSFHHALTDANLISLFGPLGLVQHIWTLWELLVTGSDWLLLLCRLLTFCLPVTYFFFALSFFFAFFYFFLLFPSRSISFCLCLSLIVRIVRCS